MNSQSKRLGLILVILIVLTIITSFFVFKNKQRDFGNVIVEEVKKEKVKVIRVIDGDTIVIEGDIKVRYIGINTPETVDQRTKIQCFGKEASMKNKELVDGKEIEMEKDISEIDKYGRLLRYVYVDGIMVNKLLVDEGFANVDTVPPDIKYKDIFVEAEKKAKLENKGLWLECKK